MKSKSVRRILVVVVLMAVVLTAAMVLRADSLRRQLSGLEAELEISLNAWQSTAAVKEELQAELTTVQQAIREAEMTLNESTQRAGELQAQVDALQLRCDQLTALRDSLKQPDASTGTGIAE